MKKLLVFLLAVAAIGGAIAWWIRGPIAQTTTAALKAYPVYSFVRTRNEALLRAAHRDVNASNLLIHRADLAGPRDRSVTTPNNDTLYSFAFLDLASGPVELTLPALPDRYHSVAVMDARTDNIVVIGSREGGLGGTIAIESGESLPGRRPPGTAAMAGTYRIPTKEAWLLIRILVDGSADLAAARSVQQGFVLAVPEASKRAPRPAILLPTIPDPALLLRSANPLIAENPHLQDAGLAATGYGGAAEAFDDLPVWRQWMWRILAPKIFAQIADGIAVGSAESPDGWSKSPPGIGTAEASDALRAGVALGGLGALPATEAVYWSATVDDAQAVLDGRNVYRLTLPATIPARAFWSLSIYEILPDGRRFYVENPIDRYAIGSRTPGLARAADGSLVLDISATPPADRTNWLPVPEGRFTLIFRAYLPEQPILDGSFRLPPVQRLP